MALSCRMTLHERVLLSAILPSVCNLLPQETVDLSIVRNYLVFKNQIDHESQDGLQKFISRSWVQQLASPKKDKRLRKTISKEIQNLN